MGKVVHRDFEIRGVVYRDIASAAKALRICKATVMAGLRVGRGDMIGLGRGAKQVMPVRIRGRLFVSARIAAAHFGVSPAAIYQALCKCYVDRIGRRRYVHATSIPFGIGGLKFPSRRSASIALGFGPGYVSQALVRQCPNAQARILAAAMRKVDRVGGGSAGVA